MALAPQEIRFATHLDITDEMMAKVEKVLKEMKAGALTNCAISSIMMSLNGKKG